MINRIGNEEVDEGVWLGVADRVCVELVVGVCVEV
jgi:hypothetical protein